MKNIPLVIVFPPKNHKARKAIYYEYCASYGQFAVCFLLLPSPVRFFLPQFS